MSYAKIVAAVLFSALFAVNSFGATLTDKELKTALVGSWVNPPDSDSDLVLPARQIFHHDGTTLLYVYATPECRVPAAAFEGRWSVVDGMLITQITRSSHPHLVAVGHIEQVAIVALEPDRVVLNADDEVYVRDKSDTCYPPHAHRT